MYVCVYDYQEEAPRACPSVYKIVAGFLITWHDKTFQILKDIVASIFSHSFIKTWLAQWVGALPHNLSDTGLPPAAANVFHKSKYMC